MPGAAREVHPADPREMTPAARKGGVLNVAVIDFFSKHSYNPFHFITSSIVLTNKRSCHKLMPLVEPEHVALMAG